MTSTWVVWAASPWGGLAHQWEGLRNAEQLEQQRLIRQDRHPRLGLLGGKIGNSSRSWAVAHKVGVRSLMPFLRSLRPRPGVGTFVGPHTDHLEYRIANKSRFVT